LGFRFDHAVQAITELADTYDGSTT